jgi:site-specific recombinase XerD
MRIPDSAVEVLLEHRSIQDKMRKSTGAIWNDNDLVFCNEIGNPLDPSGVYHYYKRLTKRLGLDQSRFHDLRHTFATIALQNGVDVKTIQETLGHYSPAFTLQVYGHVTKQMQDSGAQKVDAFLTGHTKPKGE